MMLLFTQTIIISVKSRDETQDRAAQVQPSASAFFVFCGRHQKHSTPGRGLCDAKDIYSKHALKVPAKCEYGSNQPNPAGDV